MAYTRTTWRTGETPLSAANMNNIEDGIEELRTFIEDSFNMWHPVGGYFETSDTEFDPNTAEGWYGTWVLENPGVVHVSAGAGYETGSTGGATKASYTPGGTVGGTKLTAAQSGNQTLTANTSTTGAHTHTVSGTAATAGAHGHNAYQAVASGHRAGSQGVPYRDLYEASFGGTTTNGEHTHSVSGTAASNGSHSHSVTIAAKDAASTHTHSFTGTAANIDVMQPYVVVNRWHRTA